MTAAILVAMNGLQQAAAAVTPAVKVSACRVGPGSEAPIAHAVGAIASLS